MSAAAQEVQKVVDGMKKKSRSKASKGKATKSASSAKPARRAKKTKTVTNGSGAAVRAERRVKDRRGASDTPGRVLDATLEDLQAMAPLALKAVVKTNTQHVVLEFGDAEKSVLVKLYPIGFGKKPIAKKVCDLLEAWAQTTIAS